MKSVALIALASGAAAGVCPELNLDPAHFAIGMNKIIETHDPNFLVAPIGEHCTTCLFLVRDAASKLDECNSASSTCKEILMKNEALKADLEGCTGYDGVMGFTRIKPQYGSFNSAAFNKAITAKKAWSNSVLLSMKSKGVILDVMRSERRISSDVLKGQASQNHADVQAKELSVIALRAEYSKYAPDERGDEVKPKPGDGKGEVDTEFEKLLKQLEEENKTKRTNMVEEEERKVKEAKKKAESKMEEVKKQQEVLKTEREAVLKQLQSMIEERESKTKALASKSIEMERLKERQKKMEDFLSNNDVPFYVKFGLYYVMAIITSMIFFSLYFCIASNLKTFRHSRTEREQSEASLLIANSGVAARLEKTKAATMADFDKEEDDLLKARAAVAATKVAKKKTEKKAVQAVRASLNSPLLAEGAAEEATKAALEAQKEAEEAQEKMKDLEAKKVQKEREAKATVNSGPVAASKYADEDF